MSIIQKAWDTAVRPVVKAVRRRQVAALCYREVEGSIEVLLITSRGTGRWILPKGWPMKGKKNAEAAAIEAWEEAGVEADLVVERPLGDFFYVKDKESDAPVACDTSVFAVRVKRLVDDFPEAGQRERKWLPIDEAAALVREKGLRNLLLAFDPKRITH